MKRARVVLLAFAALGGCGRSEPPKPGQPPVAAAPATATPASPATTPAPPASPEPARLPEAPPVPPRHEPPPPPKMEVYPADAPVKLDGIEVRDGKINLALSGIPESASMVTLHGLDAWLGQPRSLRYWSLGAGRLQYEVGPARDLESGGIISFSVELGYAKPLEIHAWDISQMVHSQDVAAKLGHQWRLTHLEASKEPRRLVARMVVSGDITSFDAYAEIAGPWGRTRSNPFSATVEADRTSLRLEFDVDPDAMRTRTTYLRIWCLGARVHFQGVKVK